MELLSLEGRGARRAERNGYFGFIIIDSDYKYSVFILSVQYSLIF
jgi:hypothetical protein